MSEYRKWFVAETTSFPLKVHSPLLPLLIVLQVLVGQTAASLKTPFPPSPEAYGQTLASGMWAQLFLWATSRFVLKRNGCVLPWPFLTGWDTDVSQEVEQLFWTQNGICVLSVLSLDSYIRENQLQFVLVTTFWGLLFQTVKSNLKK